MNFRPERCDTDVSSTEVEVGEANTLAPGGAGLAALLEEASCSEESVRTLAPLLPTTADAT